MLKRDEVKRLLQAASGMQWDAETGSMRPMTRRRKYSRIQCVEVARFILLATLTGCAEIPARALVWGPPLYPGESFIDLKKGTINRRGANAPKFEKFAEAAVRIPSWLLRLMRRWHRRDRQLGVRHVLHLSEGRTRTTGLAQALRAVAKRAGLEAISQSLLLDTFIGTALTRGAPLYSVSIATGQHPVALRKRYDHFRFDFQERPMRAMDRFLTSDETAPKAPAKRKGSGPAH